MSRRKHETSGAAEAATKKPRLPHSLMPAVPKQPQWSELPYSTCVARDASEAARQLDDLGFTVLEKLVSPVACADVRALIEMARARASSEDYTPIHNPRLRKDLPLGLHRFSSVLHDMLTARDCLLRKVLEDAVGLSAGLVEFATMTILPGAEAQPVHQDVHQATGVARDNARYITVFLSLCDVPLEQGPMELWAGTHKMYIPWEEKGGDSDSGSSCSSSCDDEAEESHTGTADGEGFTVQGATPGEDATNLAALTVVHMGRAKGTVRLLVREGDVYLVDPRVLHRGMANQTTTSKQMLYFSVEQREGRLRLLGSTDSMLERLKGKFTLADICTT